MCVCKVNYILRSVYISIYLYIVYILDVLHPAVETVGAETSLCYKATLMMIDCMGGALAAKVSRQVSPELGLPPVRNFARPPCGFSPGSPVSTHLPKTLDFVSSLVIVCT